MACHLPCGPSGPGAQMDRCCRGGMPAGDGGCIARRVGPPQSAGSLGGNGTSTWHRCRCPGAARPVVGQLSVCRLGIEGKGEELVMKPEAPERQSGKPPDDSQGPRGAAPVEPTLRAFYDAKKP